MSALRIKKGAAISQTLAERTRGVVTPLNLHFAGVGLLALVNLYLIAHMLFAWRAASSQNADALAQQRITLKAAEISAKPLQGLDAKLTRASAEADEFYRLRLPVSYSQVAGELGSLATADKVKLTRVQYAQAPVLGDTSGELTQVKMDASLSGDYRPLMLFLNHLERDKQFFLISGVTLTGGQAGTVNLRVGLTTYIPGLSSEEEMKKVSVGTGADAAPAAARPAGGLQ